jgi:Flp pilus assembly protein TadG
MFVTRRKSKRSVRRGVALVEFALTAPLLFLILFASIEFMRVNTIVNSIENAAYEGARRGIVPGATADEVVAEAKALTDAIGIRNAVIDVEPTEITLDTPQITVTVNVPADSNAFIAPRFFAGDTITKTCTLSREVSDSKLRRRATN